jgi:hypothetical protein
MIERLNLPRIDLLPAWFILIVGIVMTIASFNGSRHIEILAELLLSFSMVWQTFLLSKYFRPIDFETQCHMTKLTNSDHPSIRLLGATGHIKLLRVIFCQLGACWCGIFLSSVYAPRVIGHFCADLMICSIIGMLYSLCAYNWFEYKARKIAKTILGKIKMGI